jgi:hypothetical protein
MLALSRCACPVTLWARSDTLSIPSNSYTDPGHTGRADVTLYEGCDELAEADPRFFVARFKRSLSEPNQQRAPTSLGSASGAQTLSWRGRCRRVVGWGPG